ncbi:MAG TPA: polysaccharide biosynthesis tyrosine autokinase [Blastococcus sp.]|nr:polysaccharide biosynthesis tyrosine autokinase [Blastococcus sp.]
MQLRELLAALRAGWWLLVVGLVVGGAAAVAVDRFTLPVYTSHTEMFVSTTDSTSATEALQGGQFSQQRVTSYARLLTSDHLVRDVIDRLGLQRTPESLAADIHADAVPDTVLLDVSVTDPSPERAQLIAGAVGDVFRTTVATLETPQGAAASPVKVTVISGPDLPSSPSAPSPARDTIVGLLAGLVVGAGIAVARARLDRSVRDAQDAAALTGVPVIGMILRDEGLAKGHVIDRTGSERTVEDYRQLKTNLQFLSVDDPPKVIMVSSALPAEGKTTLSINLALALAEGGLRVALVEADLRRPRVTHYLELVSGPGLTNVLAATAEFDEVVQLYSSTGVSVLAAGPTPPNPGELLASAHMSTLLDKLRGTHDFVIIDAPPLLPVADASGLAPLVDGVVLSVRYGSTRKDHLRQATLTLERVHAGILGLVLNIVPAKAGVATSYGKGYGKGYADADAGGKHAVT